jgi:hypothetical protein
LPYGQPALLSISARRKMADPLADHRLQLHLKSAFRVSGHPPALNTPTPPSKFFDVNLGSTDVAEPAYRGNKTLALWKKKNLKANSTTEWIIS